MENKSFIIFGLIAVLILFVLLYGAPLKERKEIRDAYHMNKEHWISVVLGQIEDMTDVVQLLETSFELTKSNSS